MSARPILRLARSPRRVAALAAAAPLMLTLAGCEFPTELPKWNTTWIVPGETTTISVNDLLPASVTASGNTFAAVLQPSSFSRTLGEMCGTVCTLASGLTLPKPAFTTTFQTSFALPSDVVSATLASGQLQFQLFQDFGFDPIRPSAMTRGTITLTLSTPAGQIAQDVISGQSTAFPSGSTLTRTIPVNPATVTGPLTLRVEIDSPAGDPARIDPNSRLTFTPQVRLSEAVVRVNNRTLNGERVELELDVDRELTDRAVGGALLLDVENPFQVTGNLRLTLEGPGTRIEKTVTLRPGNNPARVDFSEQEIRSILSDDSIDLRVSGTVSAPSGGVTIRPGQVVTIRSRLELILGASQQG